MPALGLTFHAVHGDGLPEPQRLHARVASQDALQARQSMSTLRLDRLKPSFDRADTPSPTGPAGRKASTKWSCCSIAAAQSGLLFRSMTQYPMLWRGTPPRRLGRVAAGGRAGSLPRPRDLVAEYDAIAPTRRAARRAAIGVPRPAPAPGPAAPLALQVALRASYHATVTP